MKFLTKLSFLSLLAISANTTTIKPEDSVTLSTQFTNHLNQAFSELLNGSKNLKQVLAELEAAAQQENHPTLQNEIGFLKQNYAGLILYKNKLITLLETIKVYLTDAIRDKIDAMQPVDWLKIVMRK